MAEGVRAISTTDVLQFLRESGVLQILLGGILGVLVTQIVTSVREGRERKRERRGLLRILLAEVSYNQTVLKVINTAFRAGMKRAAEQTLADEDIYTDTWEATRLELAHHLSSEEFAVLAGYYFNLVMLKKKPTAQLGDIEISFVAEVAPELHRRGRKVTEIILSHVPDATTDEITGADMRKQPPEV